MRTSHFPSVARPDVALFSASMPWSVCRADAFLSVKLSPLFHSTHPWSAPLNEQLPIVRWLRFRGARGGSGGSAFYTGPRGCASSTSSAATCSHPHSKRKCACRHLGKAGCLPSEGPSLSERRQVRGGVASLRARATRLACRAPPGGRAVRSCGGRHSAGAPLERLRIRIAVRSWDAGHFVGRSGSCQALSQRLQRTGTLVKS